MTRLAWGTPSERYYETGVDRGVLYVDPDLGVAWNGLISVSENPSGSNARATYIDGIKVRNVQTTGDFEAVIDTFSVPEEFGPCDGTSHVGNGLMISNQPRKSFNFSYRSLIGNAVDKNLAYKIHLVYNALASPTSKTRNTLSDSSDVANMSWNISTRPPRFDGYKPTPHFIIDTRYTPELLLSQIEGIIYGSNEAPARIPPVSEIITMFKVVA